MDVSIETKWIPFFFLPHSTPCSVHAAWPHKHIQIGETSHVLLTECLKFNDVKLESRSYRACKRSPAAREVRGKRNFYFNFLNSGVCVCAAAVAAVHLKSWTRILFGPAFERWLEIVQCACWDITRARCAKRAEKSIASTALRTQTKCTHTKLLSIEAQI